MPKASFPLVVALLLSSTLPALAQTGTASDEWRVTVYPIYGWVPVFGADVTLPEQPCDDCEGGIEVPGGHVDSHLNGAALAAVRVEKGRWMAQAQGLWAGLEGEVDRPFLNVKVGLAFGEVLGGFAVAPNLYVEGGARRLALNLRAQAFNLDEVQWKPGFWEPVIGASYTPKLRARTRLYLHGDYGGADGNKTAALTGKVEWQAMSHLSITAGYGMFYLRADGSIGRKPVALEQTLHGPIVGIGIPF